MNARTSASFTLVAALLAAAPAPAPVRAADDPNDVAALSKKLRKLEEEVAALRQRLAEMGREPSFRLQPALPQSGDAPVPPDWQPRQFNGQRYYVIPLSHEDAPAPQ